MPIVLKKKTKPPVSQTPKQAALSVPKGNPRECKACKHMYYTPCDGEKDDCPNLMFMNGQLQEQ